jgi:hypothetical protein
MTFGQATFHGDSGINAVLSNLLQHKERGNKETPLTLKCHGPKEAPIAFTHSPLARSWMQEGERNISTSHLCYKGSPLRMPGFHPDLPHCGAAGHWDPVCSGVQAASWAEQPDFSQVLDMGTSSWLVAPNRGDWGVLSAPSLHSKSVKTHPPREIQSKQAQPCCLEPFAQGCPGTTCMASQWAWMLQHTDHHTPVPLGPGQLRCSIISNPWSQWL